MFKHPWRFSHRLSLTTRILAVNILPLALLGGGIFYLDSYRKQLLSERYQLARIEAQITAEALAGATRERQDAVLTEIGKEQHMRVRTFDPQGRLEADSFRLDKPTFAFDVVGDEDLQERVARWLDRAVNWIVGADPIPDYVEPSDTRADAWPELRRAREEHLTQIELREAPDGTPVITAAAPVGLHGSTLLTTRNAVDITDKVRSARGTLGIAVALALATSILLSLFMARTIVTPLRTLARAAIRVRLGRDRGVEVPRLPERHDEIGLLARAVADMTGALRHRIDAVESFAADVAHEIKNPLASLRSAVEFAWARRRSRTAQAAYPDRRPRRPPDRPPGERNLRSQPHRRRAEPGDIRGDRHRQAGRQPGGAAQDPRRERHLQNRTVA